MAGRSQDYGEGALETVPFLLFRNDYRFMELEAYLRKMRQDWDGRARQNARHFIVDVQPDWTEADFYASGVRAVAEDIRTDMTNICQGGDPGKMRMLEIGCGAGRVTRELAGLFGEVHGIDVSPEMVRLARAANVGMGNVFLYETDGATLPELGDQLFDFAYSCCVFQHIASYAVIESVVIAVGRVLRTGALFKFEVQGCTAVEAVAGDTWVGTSVSMDQAQRLAEQGGFDLRFSAGAGEERFWLWMFKL